MEVDLELYSRRSPDIEQEIHMATSEERNNALSILRVL